MVVYFQSNIKHTTPPNRRGSILGCPFALRKDTCNKQSTVWHCREQKQQSHLHQVCQKGDKMELADEDKDGGVVPAMLVSISAQPMCERSLTCCNHSTGNPNRRRARASFIPPILPQRVWWQSNARRIALNEGNII